MYEAPHRVAATVADIVASFGDARTLVVAREITKAFETIARMPLADAVAWFAADANRVRGEFVLIVDAPEQEAAQPAMLDETAERWLAALARGAAAGAGRPRRRVGDRRRRAMPSTRAR